MGSTLNLASRLEGIAKKDEIIVSRKLKDDPRTIQFTPVSKDKRKEKNVENKVSSGREDIRAITHTEKIFCRHCGKQREASGEFCSRCGRGTQSTSTKMKICRNCSSPTAEDSEFCANCGQKFEEKTNMTGGAKRFYYTSDGKKKERSTAY